MPDRKVKNIYEPASHEREIAAAAKSIQKQIDALNTEILAYETTLERLEILNRQIHNLEVKFYQLSKPHHTRKQAVDTVAIKGLTH